MPSAQSIINKVNRALSKTGPYSRTVGKRVITRTGGDPLIGIQPQVTYTDTVFSPQPYFSRIGREHIPGGHADWYQYIDANGNQIVADDYEVIFSASMITLDDLENPDVLLTFTDSKGNVEPLRITDPTPLAIFGGDVAFIVYVRSLGEKPAQYSQAFASAAALTVPHNMDTNSVVPFVTDASGNPMEYGNFSIINTNSAQLTFATAATGTVVVKSVQALAGYATYFGTGTVNGQGEYVVPIQHNLGTTSVSVCVYNKQNEQVIQFGTLTVVDANNITLTLAAPMVGNIIVYPS